MNPQLESLERYFGLMAANGADRVYHTAVESGLLDALLGTTRTTSDLADQINADERAVEQVCEVLDALDVIAQNTGRWKLTPLGDSLIRGPYRYLGDPYWSHLPEFMQTGEPMAKMDDPAESEAQYQGQAAALGWMLAPAAAWAAEAIASEWDADHPLNILDAGAGSAIWSLSLAARFESSNITAADWPGVLEVAGATAQRMGLADRLSLLPGDLAKAELPTELFDVVFLANVAHLLPPDALSQTLQRLALTLRPGGRLVVVDVFPGLSPGDLNRTLYTLGLSLRTKAGQTHQADDVLSLMGKIGLVDGTFVPIEVVPFTLGMAIARKP